MKFILAKKVNMTQIFGENGAVEPATVLDVGPSIVSQIKTKEKDGYSAVQIGTGSRKGKNISKPVKGHIKGLDLPAQAGGSGGEKAGFFAIKEFKMADADLGKFNKGDKIGLETFAVGDKVTVSSVSKGKGFQGVVKRHGFHGGPRSHGQKHSEREPGSIGGGGRSGGKVIKGMRMAGRMGGDRVTIKNLRVLGVDSESNTMLLSGAVPGRRGTLVEIRG
jgi:large subunit ribosomal protein L3